MRCYFVPGAQRCISIFFDNLFHAAYTDAITFSIKKQGTFTINRVKIHPVVFHIIVYQFHHAVVQVDILERFTPLSVYHNGTGIAVDVIQIYSDKLRYAHSGSQKERYYHIIPHLLVFRNFLLLFGESFAEIYTPVKCFLFIFPQIHNIFLISPWSVYRYARIIGYFVPFYIKIVHRTYGS